MATLRVEERNSMGGLLYDHVHTGTDEEIDALIEEINTYLSNNPSNSDFFLIASFDNTKTVQL